MVNWVVAHHDVTGSVDTNALEGAVQQDRHEATVCCSAFVQVILGHGDLHR